MISQVVKLEVFPFKKLEQGGMFWTFLLQNVPKKEFIALRVQSCLFYLNLSDDKLPVSLVLPDCEGPLCWI